MTTAIVSPAGDESRFDVSAEIARVSSHVAAVKHLIDKHMVSGIHYAIIDKKGKKDKPTNGGIDMRDKPSLLKPGADLACSMFRLAPEYSYSINPLPGGHREYIFTCTIKHAGESLGQGVGSCSSAEPNFRYINDWIKTDKKIPREYQELKKNGDWKRIAELLGGKDFAVRQIDGVWCVAQKGQQKERDDIAEKFNVCLKMAKKRALIDAVLTATAASSVFTQDLDDNLENLEELSDQESADYDIPPPSGAAPRPTAAPAAQASATPKQYASDADIQATIKAFAAKGVAQGELEKLVNNISAHWTPETIIALREEYKRRGFAAKTVASTSTPVAETTTNTTPADPLAELRKAVRSKLLSFSGDMGRAFIVMLGGDIDKATEAQLRTTMTVMEQTTEKPVADTILPIVESVRTKVETLIGDDKPAWANRVMEIFTGTMDYAVAGKVDLMRANEAVKFADTLIKLCERRRPKTLDDWTQAAESIVNGDSPAQEPWA